MALEIDSRGILPVDVHDTDIHEIGRVFGQFQRTDRRMRLFQSLCDYVDALRGAEIRGSLIIDGSFVMKQVDEPDDIDVILVLAGDWDLQADLSPFQYNLVSKRDVKRRFPIEVYSAPAGTETESTWIEYFKQINVKWYAQFGFNAGAEKGLVRISL